MLLKLNRVYGAGIPLVTVSTRHLTQATIQPQRLHRPSRPIQPQSTPAITPITASILPALVPPLTVIIQPVPFLLPDALASAVYALASRHILPAEPISNVEHRLVVATVLGRTRRPTDDGTHDAGNGRVNSGTRGGGCGHRGEQTSGGIDDAD